MCCRLEVIFDMGMRDTPGAYTRGACEVVQIQLTYLATPPAPSFEMDGMIKHETPPSNNIPRVEFFRPNFLQKTTASTVPGNSIMATKAKSLYTSPSRSDDPDQAIRSSVNGGPSIIKLNYFERLWCFPYLERKPFIKHGG